MTLILDPRRAWESALALARKGEPQHLARLIVREPPPDDMKAAVRNVLAHPRLGARARTGGKKRAASPLMVALVRGLYAGIVPDAAGETKKKEARAIVAEATGLTDGTIRRILEERGAYSAKLRN